MYCIYFFLNLYSSNEFYATKKKSNIGKHAPETSRYLVFYNRKCEIRNGTVKKRKKNAHLPADWFPQGVNIIYIYCIMNKFKLRKLTM